MTDSITVAIRTQGNVGDAAGERLQGHLQRLTGQVAVPVRFASGTIVRSNHAANPAPVHVSATVDLDGHWVRAHVDGTEENEAIDLLDGKLRRLVRRYNEQRQHKGNLHRPVTGGDGHWRHGDLPTDRPPWYERPEEEREVVPRALRGPERRTVQEAAFDLERQGERFALFVDEVSGCDSVLSMGDDDEMELMQLDPSEAMTTLEVAEAIEQLESGGAVFLFFADAATGRGAVVYHRSDGHYGLVRITSELAAAE